MQSDSIKVMRTVCSPNCGGTCGINAFVDTKTNTILKIEPGDFPDSRFKRMCIKGIAMAMERVSSPNRVPYPMKRKGSRGSGEWTRLSWEEAYNHIAEGLDKIVTQYGPRANAFVGMTGNYAIKPATMPSRVAASLGGTFFSNLGLMGDLAANMGAIPTLGVMTSGNEWKDLVGTDLIIFWGKNPAETAHSEMPFIFDAVDAGARMMVIDPRYSRTAAKSDVWLSPRPGTDAAMALGVINHILDKKLYDKEFISQKTNAPFLVRSDNKKLLRACDIGGQGDGFLVWNGATTADPKACSSPALEGQFPVQLIDGSIITCTPSFEIMRRHWQQFSIKAASEICGVPEADLIKFAEAYTQARAPGIWLGQGAQRYHNGHLFYRATITLGALCGNIGKRHGGVNWMGGSIFKLGYGAPDEWMAPGGVQPNMLSGSKLFDTIETGDPYEIKSLWTIAYGLGTQVPKRKVFFDKILPKLDLFIVNEQVMAPAAQMADIVLPVTSYYEEDWDLIGSSEINYMQLRRRVLEPVGDARSDWDIFKGFFKHIGKDEHWRMSAEEVCKLLITKSKDPDVRAIDWEKLKLDGISRIGVDDPIIPFADGIFSTPSGRIELYTESLLAHGEEILTYYEPLEGAKSTAAKRFPLVLVTHHSMYSAHSTHMDLPIIKNRLKEPTLAIHPDDAAARNISTGDIVEVFNDRGKFRLRAKISSGTRRGMVNLPQGWWPQHFIEGHYGNVSHFELNPVQEAIIETNFAVHDNSVEVRQVA